MAIRGARNEAAGEAPDRAPGEAAGAAPFEAPCGQRSSVAPPRLEARPFRLALGTPLATGTTRHMERSGWLVRFSADDGLCWGLGEASPLPGHGGEAPDVVLPALETLARRLGEVWPRGWDGAMAAGAEPATLETWARAAAMAAPGAPAARAAIEFALGAWLALDAALPLARLWSPAPAGDVSVSGLVGAVRPEEAERRARALVAQGFGTMKVKVGDSLAADVARVAAVRTGAGARVALRVDANGAWEAERARAFLSAVGLYRLEYAEQPLPPDDVHGLAALRAATSVPIAVDESLLVPDGPERVLAAGAADVLVLKPGLLGGPGATLELAAAARARGCDVVVSTALDSAVGRAAALHVAAALPAPRRVAGLATGELFAVDVGRGAEVASGRIALPAVGLGVVLHTEASWAAGDWRRLGAA